MTNHSSNELKVRWAGPETEVNAWGYENAKEGWKQAYGMSEARNPKCYFQEIVVDINDQNEWVAILGKF